MQLKLFPLTKRVLFHVITVLFSLMLIIVRKFSKDQVKKKKESKADGCSWFPNTNVSSLIMTRRLFYFYKLKT